MISFWGSHPWVISYHIWYISQLQCLEYSRCGPSWVTHNMMHFQTTWHSGIAQWVVWMTSMIAELGATHSSFQLSETSWAKQLKSQRCVLHYKRLTMTFLLEVKFCSETLSEFIKKKWNMQWPMGDNADYSEVSRLYLLPLSVFRKSHLAKSQLQQVEYDRFFQLHQQHSHSDC